MNLRSEIEKRIEKKQVEIDIWENKIYEYQEQVSLSKSYIQALEDTLRLIPKDDVGAVGQQSLRPGTLVHKAREAIIAAGRPLHIDELLKAVGKPADSDNRGAMSGSLSSYVRKGQVFTRPAPNTFGLVSFPVVKTGQNGPPQNFGKDIPVRNAGAVGADGNFWGDDLHDPAELEPVLEPENEA